MLSRLWAASFFKEEGGERKHNTTNKVRHSVYNSVSSLLSIRQQSESSRRAGQESSLCFAPSKVSKLKKMFLFSPLESGLKPLVLL